MLKKILNTIISVAIIILLIAPVYAVSNPAYPVIKHTFENPAEAADWQVWGTPTGSMSIENGELKLTSTGPFTDIAAYYDNQVVKDFTAEFEIRTPEGAENDAATFIYRADSATNGYQIFFVRCPEARPRYFIKFAERPYNELKSGVFFPDWAEDDLNYATDSIKVKVVVSGGMHQIFTARADEEFGETPVMTYDETTEGDNTIKYDRYGYMGFLQWHDANERAVTSYYDNFIVTCEDEAESVIPEAEADTTPVTAGTIEENFDAELSPEWRFYRADANEGSIGITDDMLHVVTKGLNVFSESAAYYTSNFYNGTIEYDVMLSLGKSTSVVFRGQDYLRRGYQLTFDRFTGVQLSERPGGQVLAVPSETLELEYDRLYHVIINIEDNVINVEISWLDDEDKEQTRTLTYTDTENLFPEPGYVGFMNYAEIFGLTEAFYDNLVINKVVPAEPSSEPTPTVTPDNPTTGDNALYPVLFLLLSVAIPLGYSKIQIAKKRM